MLLKIQHELKAVLLNTLYSSASLFPPRLAGCDDQGCAVAVPPVTRGSRSSGDSEGQTRIWGFGKPDSNIINRQRNLVKWETYLSPGNTEEWQLWE